MKIMQKKFCRISSKDEKGENKAKKNLELFFVEIVFNNSKNFKVYNRALTEEMEKIIHKHGIIVDKDYNSNMLKISLKNQKCIMKKPADKIELAMKGWHKQIAKVMPSRMNVNISVDYEQGIIFVELK